MSVQEHKTFSLSKNRNNDSTYNQHKCRVSVSKEITSNTQANVRDFTRFKTDMECNICTDNHHTLVSKKEMKNCIPCLEMTVS